MTDSLEFCVRVKAVDNLGSKWDKQQVYLEATSDKKTVLGKTPNQVPVKGAVSWPDSGADSGIICMSFPTAGLFHNVLFALTVQRCEEVSSHFPTVCRDSQEA